MKRICLISAVILLLIAASLSEAKQSWIEVRSAHFIVVTDAGEKQARETASQLELIHSFFRQSLAISGHHPSPVVTVLALNNFDTMRDVVEGPWGGRQSLIAGIFTHPLDQYFAVVELDLQRRGYYSTFFHEYYHSLTVPSFPDLPMWLMEGLAEFYGHTEIKGDQVITGLADRDSLSALRQARFIPLHELFNEDSRQLNYEKKDKAPLFYAESWLACHYLLVGNPAAHKLFVRYLDALGHGKSWADAESEFGDLKKLQADLSSYLFQKQFLSITSPLPRSSAKEFKVRTLSEAESEAYLGGASSALGHLDEGLRRLKRAVKLDPNSSLAYEYLGMAQFLDGKRSEALKSASESVKLDPNKSSARYLRAYYATNGTEMVATDAPVEDDLRQAIILNQEFSPAYALLGLFLSVQPQRSDEGLSLAKQAVSFDPSNASYQLTVARVLAQMKRYDQAHEAAQRAGALARDANEKAVIDKFISLLPKKVQNNSAPSSSN